MLHKPNRFLLALLTILGMVSAFLLQQKTTIAYSVAAPALQSAAPLQNVKQIATSGSHTCALLTNGGVKCWGANSYGQLGDGTTTDRSTPVDVVGLSSGVTSVAAGGGHTCALLTTGGLNCWGYNLYGRLGDGTNTNRASPVDVVGLSSGVASVDAGTNHTCALLTSGGVKCWGSNSFGRLGDGTTTDRSTPVDVVGLSSGVTSVAAGGGHTCALLTTGGLKCWGANYDGRLGDGTIANHSTPVDVVGLSSGVAAVAAGGSHTCALLTTGGLKCWGSNNYGRLGDGTTTSRATPVDVVGLSSGVASVAAGGFHTCALLTSGGLKCWGNNSFGQLGDDTTTDRATPVAVVGLSSGVAAVADGYEHTCALLTTSGVKCWGSNSFGQLGDGTFGNRSTPIAVVGLNSNVAAVAAGSFHTCAVLTNGGVKCWGENYDGNLGDSTTIARSTPVDVVGLSSGVAAVAAGGHHTCALLTTGGVKCWGHNFSGQLGDSATIARSTPVDVVGLSSGVASVAAGGSHTCALLTTGGVKCWGDNDDGRLGDGTNTDRATPVDVVGLSSGVASVAAGTNHTCALLTTSGVKCWGDNGRRQLGDGTTTNRATPVDVVGLSSGVASVDAGGYHTCAVLTTGDLKCWGFNSDGQLGDGTTTDRSMPVDVVGLSSGVASVAAGNYYNCVVLTSGGLKCWGDNNDGWLGDGTTIDRATPVDVVGLSSGVATVAAGGAHTCALLTTGGLKCWGYNLYGQLGDGNAWRTRPVDVVEGAVLPSPTLTATPTPVASSTSVITPNATATATTTPTGAALPTATTPPVNTLTATPTATNDPSGTGGSTLFLPAIAQMPPPPPTVTPVPTPIPTPSWQQIAGDGLNVAALAVQSNTLFVGISGNSGNERGLYRGNLTSCSTGVALTKVSDVNRPGGESVFGIAFAGSNGVVASYDGGLYYTNDSGNTWTGAVSAVEQPGTVTHVNNTFFAGTQTNGIFQSNDGGKTWFKEAGINFPQAINAVVADSIDPAKLWIGAQNTGVWAYTVGASRQPSNPSNGLDNSARNVWDLVFDAANNIYLATEGGIYQGNGVSNWANFGPSPGNVQFRSLTLVGTTLYAGAISNGVWRKPLIGGNWERVSAPGWGETATVRDLLYDTTVCNGLLAATDDGVWLYR